MRKLQTRDLFSAGRMIKELDLKNTIKELGLKANKENSYEIGAELILRIFEKASERKSEEKIYEFLAGPFEMNPEEVAKLELNSLLENMKKISDIENLKSFFKNAAQLMK